MKTKLKAGMKITLLNKFGDEIAEDIINEVNTRIKAYLATIGSKGGKAGKGKAKSRTKEQARKAALARWKGKNAKS